jgi:hypothetical protein
MLFVPYFSCLYKIVFRQMYTVYYLLFNTVYSPTCFKLCHSSSSGTQLFIRPTAAIYVRYSLKYIRWIDKLPLTMLTFGHCVSYFMLAVCLLVVSMKQLKQCPKLKTVKGSLSIQLIYRVYTKEWCGFNSVHYYNRTILLCMPCILMSTIRL